MMVGLVLLMTLMRGVAFIELDINDTVGDNVYDNEESMLLIRVHLYKCEWHGDNTEAEVGDCQVGNKNIPENWMQSFLVGEMNRQTETQILNFLEVGFCQFPSSAKIRMVLVVAFRKYILCMVNLASQLIFVTNI